jgi:hypothetical protein
MSSRTELTTMSEDMVAEKSKDVPEYHNTTLVETVIEQFYSTSYPLSWGIPEEILFRSPKVIHEWRFQ